MAKAQYPIYFSILGYVMSSISIAGSLFVILFFICIPVLRKHPNTMLFWNALCDTVFTLYNLLIPIFTAGKFAQGSTVCKLIASIYQFLSMASVSWNFVISLDLFLLLRNPFQANKGAINICHKPVPSWIVYHCIVWSISILTAPWVWFDNGVEQEGPGICAAQGWFNLLHIIPISVYVLFSLFVVVYTTRKLLRTGLPNSLNNRLNLVGRLVFYTLFFVVLWIVPLINRYVSIVTFATGTSISPVDMYLDGAGYITEGFMPVVDVIVFGSHPAIINFILCRKSKKEIVEIEEDVEEDFSSVKANRRKSRYYRIKDANPYGFQVPVKEEDAVDNVSLKNPLLMEDSQESAQQKMAQELHEPISMTNTVQNSGTLEGVLEDVTHEKKIKKRKKVTYEVQSTPNDSSSLGINIDAVIRQDMMYCIMLGINEVCTNSENIAQIDALVQTDFRTAFAKKIKRAETIDSFSRKVQNALTTFDSFNFVAYAPKVFSCIRGSYVNDVSVFLKSFKPEKVLAQFIKENFSEGKSGSFFCRTDDNKYIIKTVSESELKTFQKILPDYAKYVTKSTGTYMCKIYGVFSISMYEGIEIKFMIMNNVFNTYLKMDERYDLKGSWINRQAWKSDDEKGGLGLDLDVNRPFDIGTNNAKVILNQLRSDSNFLASCNIMDYSLLAGIHYRDKHPEQHENQTQPHNGILGTNPNEIFFFGIIDILQEYTILKKAERGFKHYVMGKDKLGISSQPPDYYALRFQSKLSDVIK